MTQFASQLASLSPAVIRRLRPAARPGKRRRLDAVGFRLRRTTQGALIPCDQDFSMTADHLVEVPREPRVIPTGVLDEKGNMICRVIVPIMQQIGFNTGGNAWTGEAEEEVVLLQTADMIRFSDAGIGIESVDPSELEDEDEE